MKHRDILTILLFFVTFTATAQSNYSPCYTNNINKGDAAFKQGKYREARTYYVTAKKCAGGNPSVAQQKINSCDSKIKTEKEQVKEKRLEEERTKPIFTVNGITFKMILIKGGTFTMGCTYEQRDKCRSLEEPSHLVTLRDYYIGETEVTQALWKAVMGSNPSIFKGDNLPVGNVSWNDCLLFVQKLNELTGKTFRLPTEAEWEFAARGGNKSQHYRYSGGDSIDDVAWSSSTTNYFEPKPVKTKQPNELGLYDMSGNVWELCLDWIDDYTNSAQTNPTGPLSGLARVLRGGSWDLDAIFCRVSTRNCCEPDEHDSSYGFRLVLVCP